MPHPTPPSRVLTAAQARRVAIAAQLLDRPAPEPARPVNRGHLRRLVRRLGVLQIDSVNVLARAHLLPIFARLGDYPVQVLTAAAWPARSADRVLTETWAHEASLVPVEYHRLLRWGRRHWSTRMADRMEQQHPGMLDEVLAIIADIGPCSAGQVEKALEVQAEQRRAGWWEWSLTKAACEALFAIGTIGVAYRRSFERCYDLIERVLPPAARSGPELSASEAQQQLVEIAARAHGVATVKDLADYFRMPGADTRTALTALVESGAVLPVTIEGWPTPGYLHSSARIPREVQGRALLCPFDPLIWERARTERIFGFSYRIEIYTPQPKRQYGYYVCPLLLGDRLVGRFDLKADRAGGTLLVQACWSEPGVDPEQVAAGAAPELRRMAGWLGLPDLAVRERGNSWRQVSGALAGR